MPQTDDKRLLPTMLQNKLAVIRVNKLIDSVCGDATATSGVYNVPTTAGFVLATVGTINVHTAVGWKNKEITIKRIGSGTVVVDAASAETIDDELTVSLVEQYVSITIKSDDANWWII
jgi:hypothetical protein